MNEGAVLDEPQRHALKRGWSTFWRTPPRRILAGAALVVVGLMWWFGSMPAAHMLGLVFTIFPVVAVASVWAIRTLVYAITTLRWSWWVTVVPAIGIVGLGVLIIGIPGKVAWHFAEDDFGATLPAMIASKGDDAPEEIAGYGIMYVRVADDRVYYVFSGGFASDCGVAHLPNGTGPARSNVDFSEGFDLSRKSGDWYSFCAGW